VTGPGEIADEGDDGAPDASEVPLIERLRNARPEPSGEFHARLRRGLKIDPPSSASRAPTAIVGYAAAGVALLLVGVISAAGAGPLGG
jgi:hypothetical protein